MKNSQRLQQVRAISKYLTEANLMISDLESELQIAVDAEEEAIEAQGEAMEKAREHECVGDHVCNVCGKESND